ncbi:hypothetical protein BESB_075190 [Besnoitia besnoiti]|uniref:Uncharacterized protein n=1 Tax=Besnoitia besnoiti TaxID=94643 RepID=A0A2A9MFH6_BESBE|nr:uncharacterized protein BESB_075190 [Besnoitia besnoiti]PFH34367.1 hypothetical protein BESB_075190 [Besnoitia besnoiti]
MQVPARSGAAAVEAAEAQASHPAPDRGVVQAAKRHALRSATTRDGRTRSACPPTKAPAAKEAESGTPATRGPEAKKRGNTPSSAAAAHSGAEGQLATLSGGRRGQATRAAKLLADMGNLNRRERQKDQLPAKGGGGRSETTFPLAHASTRKLVKTENEKKHTPLVGAPGGRLCFLGSAGGGVYTPKQKKQGGSSRAARVTEDADHAEAAAAQMPKSSLFPSSLSLREEARAGAEESLDAEGDREIENVRVQSQEPLSNPPKTASSPDAPPSSRPPPSASRAPNASSSCSRDASSPISGYARSSSVVSSSSAASSSCAPALAPSAGGAAPIPALPSVHPSSPSSAQRSLLRFSRSSSNVFSPLRSAYSPFSVRSHGSARSADGSPSGAAACAAVPLRPEMFLNFVDSAFLVFPASREHARAAAEEALRAAADASAPREASPSAGAEPDGAREGKRERGSAADAEAHPEGAAAAEDATRDRDSCAKRRRVLGTSGRKKGEARLPVASEGGGGGSRAEAASARESAEGGRHEEEEATAHGGAASPQEEGLSSSGAPRSAPSAPSLAPASPEGGEDCFARGEADRAEPRSTSASSRPSSSACLPVSAASPEQRRARVPFSSALSSCVVAGAWPGEDLPLSPASVSSSSSSASSPATSPLPSLLRARRRRLRALAGAEAKLSLADFLREEGNRLLESVKQRELMHTLRSTALELPHPNRHGVSLIYGPRVPGDDGFDYRQGLDTHGETRRNASFCPIPETIMRLAPGALIFLTSKICMPCVLRFRERIRNLAHHSPDGMLSVQQLVLDLDINMSRGWVHYAKVILAGKVSTFLPAACVCNCVFVRWRLPVCCVAEPTPTLSFFSVALARRPPAARRHPHPRREIPDAAAFAALGGASSSSGDFLKSHAEAAQARDQGLSPAFR